MASQKPVLLVDNVFDRVVGYPLATLTATSAVVGHEARYALDARRERTWWQGAVDGSSASGSSGHLTIDHGATRSVSYNAVWIDRGHNLWGQTLFVTAFDASLTQLTSVQRAVPALNADGTYPVGGTPATGLCVTEEGALWAILPLVTGARSVAVGATYVAGFHPVFTGLHVGRLVQCDGYSRTLDEDAATRKRLSDESDAGVKATGIAYAAPRTLTLDLGTLGSATYDADIRTLQRQLFDQDRPAFVCMDYGTYPERGRYYQLDQSAWSAPTQGRYRSTTLKFREVGAPVP